MIGLEASRGCPFNCYFCQVPPLFSFSMRCKKFQRVVQEIEYFLERYKNLAFDFVDANFGLDQKWLTKFCTMINNRKIECSWSAEMRLDLVTKENIELMAESGCEYVFSGIESGSQRVLNIINKNINLERIKRNLEYFDKNKIKVLNNFMIGLPGESLDDMKKTRDFVYMISKIAKPDNHFYFCEIYQQYPGTYFYDNWDYFESKYGCKFIEKNWWKTLPPYSEVYPHILPRDNIEKSDVLTAQKLFYSKIYGKKYSEDMEIDRKITLKRYESFFEKYLSAFL